ncbi:MAG: sugar phosphate nucleotidyltransferase [Kiritimatiellia bacterium]
MNQPRPAKAFILAAGLATRLRPLTEGMPKACLPVWGKPAIHHVLDLLARWGVREALINLHHEPLAVLETARAWSGPVRLNFSFEPVKPLGTGGALRHGAWFFGGQPFWLVNADVMADLDPLPLLRAFHGPARPLAALWMVPDAGPRTVSLENGFVSEFNVSNPGTDGTLTFSGVHLVRPEVLDYMPPEPFCTIVGAYRKAIAAGHRIAGVTVPGSYWEDIGILSEYLRAHGQIEEAWRKGRPGGRLYDAAAPSRLARLRRNKVRVEGFAAVAPDAVIGPGSLLRDCVVWSGATVEPGTTLNKAVLARNVRVHGAVEGMAISANGLAGAGPFLEKAGWPVHETTALPLGPRASDRSFARLMRPGKSAILVRYGRARHENTLCAGHTHFLLRHRIRVPKLLAQDARGRLLLFEDCGNRDLLAALAGASGAGQLALYLPVLALAARLHTTATEAARHERLRLVTGFSPKLYSWERHYFANHFLKARCKLPEKAVRPILRELATLARRLQESPRVLIHRDLQSTNVLLTARGPVLIDYQGMRLGAAAYDVASLLADPYVSLSETVQMRLLADYRKAAGSDLSAELFWTAAIQRLAQALGAYGRLGAIPATAAFARHIPAACRMMLRAADHLGPARMPHLRQFLQNSN